MPTILAAHVQNVVLTSRELHSMDVSVNAHHFVCVLLCLNYMYVHTCMCLYRETNNAMLNLVCLASLHKFAVSTLSHSFLPGSSVCYTECWKW